MWPGQYGMAALLAALLTLFSAAQVAAGSRVEADLVGSISAVAGRGQGLMTTQAQTEKAHAENLAAKAHRARVLLVRHARQVLGRPYRWGASGPAAFDCSGLVRWLYGRIGIRLPRQALQQGQVGLRVRTGLKLGDTLLFRSSRSPTGWHIGLYLGRGYFLHAAGREKGVIVSPLTRDYARRLVVARRYLP